MSIKVIHVTSMHTWDDDRIFERACVGLTQRGFDISLVASPVALNKEAKEGISYQNDDVKSNVKLLWIKLRAGAARRIFSSQEAIRRAIMENPDIIHFHDPDIMPWAWLYSYKFKGKIIFDIHENYCARIEKLALPGFFRSFLMQLYRGFEKLVINRIAGFVTTTESMKTLYASVSSPGISISNMPFLSRLPQKHKKKHTTDITVVTSGTNSNARNCLQTIKAIPFIIKKYPNIKFKFLGRYRPSGFKERLQNLTDELDVASYVKFEGMVPWLANFDRVGQCDIGCVFYEDNLNNRVTIPNRLFEYMSMGLAIIGENFTEVSKVLKKANCGITVNSSNPESIANGIISLIEHPDGYAKLGNNGKKEIENSFNFEHELVRLSQFYQQLEV